MSHSIKKSDFKMHSDTALLYSILSSQVFWIWWWRFFSCRCFF